MKKIFSILLLILIASASILSGCNLVTRNDYKYFSTTVIKVGAQEFTKEELILRFNQIGAQYLQEGFSIEQAMEYTINSIVSRELILTHAKEVLGELTQAEKNQIWQDIYDFVNEQLKGFEEQIIDDWGITLIEATETTEPTKHEVYKPYEPTVIYKDGEFILVEPEILPEEEPIGPFVREDFNPGIDQTISQKTYEQVQTEAWNRYIKALKNGERWKKLSTVNEEVFERELQKLYELYEGNKYVAKLEEHFNATLGVQTSRVVDRYIELVMDSFEKFSTDMQAYHDAMSSDHKTVYYHPNSGEEYIYVSHILIQFSEEQKAQLEEYKTQKSLGQINATEYDYLVEQLRHQIGTRARDEEGLEYGEVVLASDILAQVQAALAPFGNDVDKRAAKFNEFIYKYNQDPGIFNQEVPYVVNLNTSVQDKMVKAFADASRELYTLGEGSLSELVVTDFGYHIIFYSRPVTNVINYNNLQNITAEALYNTALSAGLEKTLYHKVLDSLSSRDYSNYQTSLINQLKSETEIVLYESRYNDLLR